MKLVVKESIVVINTQTEQNPEELLLPGNYEVEYIEAKGATWCVLKGTTSGLSATELWRMQKKGTLVG